MSIMLITKLGSVTKSDKISLDKLNYYKSNFVNLVNSEKIKKNNHWLLAIKWRLWTNQPKRID